MTVVIVIMGVSGCGKSTISKALGTKTGWRVLEGDDYHPNQNIQKMSEGRPLTDHDRTAWVDAINKEIACQSASPIILACSALTLYVQTCLENVHGRTCTWILLDGSDELIKQRMVAREGHFMKADMLNSQFTALNPPSNAIKISIDQSIEAITEDILRAVT